MGLMLHLLIATAFIAVLHSNPIGEQSSSASSTTENSSTNKPILVTLQSTKKKDDSDESKSKESSEENHERIARDSDKVSDKPQYPLLTRPAIVPGKSNQASSKPSLSVLPASVQTRPVRDLANSPNNSPAQYGKINTQQNPTTEQSGYLGTQRNNEQKNVQEDISRPVRNSASEQNKNTASIEGTTASYSGKNPSVLLKTNTQDKYPQ